MAIYATSNRRHLVRQTFTDRAGDEVDASETISEKTALAERFGLRIPYLTMNKQGYLALVDYLLTGPGSPWTGTPSTPRPWPGRSATRGAPPGWPGSLSPACRSESPGSAFRRGGPGFFLSPIPSKKQLSAAIFRV